VPAASVAVVHDQDVLWSRGLGFTDRARRVPASADTRFSICSISKLFTSIAAMRLRDAGQLDLDAPVSTYLPWYPDDSAAATTGPVTVRSILSHVSGMPREANAPYWATREFPDESDLKDLLERQDANAPAFVHFDYSNLGMVLLGEIVASLTGTNYQTHVQRKLLEPLGLSQTTPRWPRELYGTEFALGYAARNGRGERKALPFYEIGALTAAAGFSSSAADLARFASWQFRVLDGNDAGVLASTTLHEMQRVHWMSLDGQGERWGLGFRLQQRGGEMLVGHEGGCPGFTSSLIMQPADKIAVIVLVDVNDVDAGEVALNLYDLLAEPIRAAYPRTAVVPADASPDPAIFEGVYGRPEYHNDIYVLAEEGGLMTISLYARAPAERIEHYRYVDGTTFRRLRPDGSLAETLRFELNDRGEPARAWRNSQFLDHRPLRANGSATK
jgi:CubicO group peptidase (beta-lactamase class C family)